MLPENELYGTTNQTFVTYFQNQATSTEGMQTYTYSDWVMPISQSAWSLKDDKAELEGRIAELETRINKLQAALDKLLAKVDEEKIKELME